jgi:hypothetical protein
MRSRFIFVFMATKRKSELSLKEVIALITLLDDPGKRTFCKSWSPCHTTPGNSLGEQF